MSDGLQIFKNKAVYETFNQSKISQELIRYFDRKSSEPKLAA